MKKHNNFGGAVLTTTNYSLDKWKNIIDTYMAFGCTDLFLRVLTPLGYANDHWAEIGYNIEDFLEFYRNSMKYILDLNKKGICFREMHVRYYF